MLNNQSPIVPEPGPGAPRVLVLLATYNGAPWLAEQLDSILSQEGVTLRICIGDDCSSDATVSVIDHYIARHGQARIARLGWSSGSGSAGANFRRLYAAVEMQEVDFVALADQDDLWGPRKLLTAIDTLRADNALAYSAAVHAFWPDGREAVLGQSPVTRAADFIFEGAGQGCTFVMAREFFLRVQSFCRVHPAEAGRLHYHDWLVYLLARTWDVRWVFDPQPTMRYRQHGGNEIGARGGWAAVQRRLKLIRNGWYRGQLGAASDLYRLAGGESAGVLELTRRWTAGAVASKGSLVDRMSLGLRLLRAGRRRLTDRGVLVLAALVGWI